MQKVWEKEWCEIHTHVHIHTTAVSGSEFSHVAPFRTLASVGIDVWVKETHSVEKYVYAIVTFSLIKRSRSNRRTNNEAWFNGAIKDSNWIPVTRFCGSGQVRKLLCDRKQRSCVTVNDRCSRIGAKEIPKKQKTCQKNHFWPIVSVTITHMFTICGSRKL